MSDYPNPYTPQNPVTPDSRQQNFAGDAGNGCNSGPASVFCPFCGAPTAPQNAVCSHCGSPLHRAPAPPPYGYPAPYGQNTAYQAAYPPPAASVSAGKKRSLGTYLGWFALALLVGNIPIVGLIVQIVLCLVGDDEERKNFFRAYFIFSIIMTILAYILVLLLCLYASAILPYLMEMMDEMYYMF